MGLPLWGSRSDASDCDDGREHHDAGAEDAKSGGDRGAVDFRCRRRLRKRDIRCGEHEQQDTRRSQPNRFRECMSAPLEKSRVPEQVTFRGGVASRVLA